MKQLIHSPQELGLALRAARKTGKVRLDDLAQMISVSKQTVTNVEQGRPTVQLGTVLRLLAEVGITVTVDIPDNAAELFSDLKVQREALLAKKPGE